MGSLKSKSDLPTSGLPPLSVTGKAIHLAGRPTKPQLLLQSMCPMSVRNTSTASQRGPGSLYTALKTQEEFCLWRRGCLWTRKERAWSTAYVTCMDTSEQN